ncbi:hypothetical protein A3736_08445 [Erythrobacter sp. HI0063]|jgi:uncharacterized membrane protein YcaP (DUF421 family)|uniref:DUF421 domain-containing protein n=2 Tax=Erythrobacter sp. HI0063 TaxID=1822240 RepID=UPI0007C2D026|nr:YetF domain-containing protein [Erythrobacter sp. HI0063]KZY56293.1 hypothetical protein A3736_08445 [Erythrobacter sp. HI0063]
MPEAFNITSDWPRIAEIAGNAILFYVMIIVMVRLVGKRTTSQLNNFDWIINVTVGSLAASGILLKNVATLDALVAIAVLALCQYATTRLVWHSRRLAHVVKAEPTLLTHKGKFLRDAMKRTRITEEEIKSALREHGITKNDGANWVVLETNGNLSVVPRQEIKWEEAETLSDVRAPNRMPGR